MERGRPRGCALAARACGGERVARRGGRKTGSKRPHLPAIPRLLQRGLAVVVIGHAGHAEVKGIVGEVEAVPGAQVFVYPDLPPAGAKIGVVSQTTMNSDEVAQIVARLRDCYEVETEAKVCNATKERQDAVKSFGGDAVIVLGDAASSNTRRLAEVARCRAFRVGTLEELKALDLTGINHLGITAGASTPESFLSQALEIVSS